MRLISKLRDWPIDTSAVEARVLLENSGLEIIFAEHVAIYSTILKPQNLIPYLRCIPLKS